MAIANSPLRYPGGKQILGKVLAHLVELNGCTGGTYVEPYAGGAGAALYLLFNEHVDRICINDADPCIHAFWFAILNRTEAFLKLLRDTPATVDEWARQRTFYRQPRRHSALRVGFATFYLNRCNRSGIIANGGPIGGQHQEGEWKIDARLNRAELESRIRRVALYSDRISVTNLDAIDFLADNIAPLGPKAKPFVYLDPPYYRKGADLYLNHYVHEDHEKLARFVSKQAHFPWIMSYDRVPEIVALYRGTQQVTFDLDYSARERRVGREILIVPSHVRFPSAWARRIPPKFVNLRLAG